MEVHHHTNSSPGHIGSGRRKWTHYFWEFLMLFLAVFCGFLAENQREHMVEHSREKQYMRSLLIDLAADTARFNRSIPLKEARVKAIDSVFMFFNANPGLGKISGKFFKTLRRTTYDQTFTRNTITINQLKNAGGMRLIRNRSVVDSIVSYDFNCEYYKALYGEYYIIHQQLDFRYLEKLVTAAQLLPLYMANEGGGIVQNIPDTMNININTSQLNEQLNFLMQVKVYARQEINQQRRLRSSAENLMELIKGKYGG